MSVCVDRQKVASTSKETKQFSQYLRQENPDNSKSPNHIYYPGGFPGTADLLLASEKQSCIVTSTV